MSLCNQPYFNVPLEGHIKIGLTVYLQKYAIYLPVVGFQLHWHKVKFLNISSSVRPDPVKTKQIL